MNKLGRESDVKRGVWDRSKAQEVTPREWRRNGGLPAPETSGCQIKANNDSSSNRIYRVSGARSYTKIKINESNSDRWSSSEAEARAAGWRTLTNLTSANSSKAAVQLE